MNVSLQFAELLECFAKPACGPAVLDPQKPQAMESPLKRKPAKKTGRKPRNRK